MAEQRPGTRLRIVNAGHWMYTFDQQLVLMKEMIERYRPAVVVQGFYWMHVRSLFNHRLVRGPDSMLQSVEDSKIMVNDRGILKFHSDWLERPPLGSQLLATVARAILNRNLNEKAALWVDYMRPGNTQDEGLWALTGEIVAETIRTLGTAGIAYVPFLIPASVEAGGTSWANVGWTAPTPPTGVEVGLPAARLAAFCAAGHSHRAAGGADAATRRRPLFPGGRTLDRRGECRRGGDSGAACRPGAGRPEALTCFPSGGER